MLSISGPLKGKSQYFCIFAVCNCVVTVWNMEKKLYPMKFMPIASRKPWGSDRLVSVMKKKFVEADGQGNEASSYNVYWLDNLRGVNEAFEGSRFEDKSFNNNPKYMRMFYANLPLIAGTYSPQIGDTGGTADTAHWVDIDEATKGWQITGDPLFAQVLYFLNGNSVEGLSYGITERNPESVANAVKEVLFDKVLATQIKNNLENNRFDDKKIAETVENLWLL